MATDSMFMMRRPDDSMKRRMNWCWVKLLNFNFLSDLMTDSVMHPWRFKLLGLDLLVLNLPSHSGRSVMNRIDMGSFGRCVMHNWCFMSGGHVMGNRSVVSCGSLMMDHWSHVRFGSVMGHRSLMVSLGMVDRSGYVVRGLMGRRRVMKNWGLVLLASMVSNRLCRLLYSVMHCRSSVMRSRSVMGDGLVLRLLGLPLLVSHQLLEENLWHLDILNSFVIFLHLLLFLFRFFWFRSGSGCRRSCSCGNKLHSSWLVIGDVVHLRLVNSSVGHVIVTRPVVLIPGAEITRTVKVAGLGLEVVRLFDNILIVGRLHETRLSIAIVILHEGRVAGGRRDEVAIVGVIIGLLSRDSGSSKCCNSE